MDVRRRILTRIVWLGLTQQEFSGVIRMDKGSFSRALRAERPRPATILRIAVGLGISVEDLLSDDPEALLRPHPGIDAGTRDALAVMRSWFDANYSDGGDDGH